MVYLVWMNDMVLGVRKTYRRAENLANTTMRRADLGGPHGWTGWTQRAQGKARWHNPQIARLEIEPRRVL